MKKLVSLSDLKEWLLPKHDTLESSILLEQISPIESARNPATQPRSPQQASNLATLSGILNAEESSQRLLPPERSERGPALFVLLHSKILSARKWVPADILSSIPIADLNIKALKPRPSPTILIHKTHARPETSARYTTSRINQSSPMDLSQAESYNKPTEATQDIKSP